MQQFKGRVVVPGTCTAEALVSHGGFNTLASYQMAMMFGDKQVKCGDQNNPDIYKKPMIGKALCLPQTIGSTTGGIKSDRMMFLCKEVKYQLRMVLHPASVKDIRVNGRVIRQNDIAPHILYIALYGLVVIISLAACLTLDPDNNQSFTAILSSLGNVGLSVDQLGSIYSYSGEPSSLKFIYTLDMFLGRVEIYPILAVVMMIFSRRNK
jgi:hypothetical protein